MFNDFFSQHEIWFSMLYIAGTITVTFFCSKYIFKIQKRLDLCSVKEMKKRYITIKNLWLDYNCFYNRIYIISQYLY